MKVGDAVGGIISASLVAVLALLIYRVFCLGRFHDCRQFHTVEQCKELLP